jgi:hypothetical protein
MSSVFIFNTFPFEDTISSEEQNETKRRSLQSSLVEEWTKFYGTPASDYAFDIECDEHDNLFMAGRWGNYYAYLTKLNTDGQEDWNWTWSGGEYSDGWGTTIDEENNYVYLAGYYGSFQGPHNVCVVKLDYSGNEVWTTTWDQGRSERVKDIALDSNGDLYVVGSSGSRAFLTKFDKHDGSELWNITWNPSQQYYSYSTSATGVDVSLEGDIYVTGKQSYEFSYSGYTFSGEKFFIRKYNSTRDKQWERAYSGSDNSLTEGWDVEVHTDGYIYAVGGDDRDIGLAKLTPDNTQVYYQIYDVSVTDVGEGLALDSNNNIFITAGTYNDSTGDWEARMLKCSNSGTLLYNRSLNFAGEDRGYSVTVDSRDNAYFCGHATLSGNQKQFLMKVGDAANLPGSFSLDSDADLPVETNGAYNLTWTASTNADNYSIYESCSEIVEINESVDLIAEGLQDTSYPVIKTDNGTYYYRAVAFNEEGNYTSNCISVEVEIPPTSSETPSEPSDSISFGMYFLIVSLASFLIIAIWMKKQT